MGRRWRAGARAWLRPGPAAMAAGPAPRFDLFTAEEMAQHGLRLAAQHRIVPGRGGDGLLDRLAANAQTVSRVCALLATRNDIDRRVTPAAEWLLDNHHLIEAEVRTARRLLPAGYSRELPRLTADSGGPQPRVYALAVQAVVHTDGRLDRGALRRFLEAYQTVLPLRLGELWAVPIMLRLALIDSLARVADRVAASLVERETAGRWADSLVQAVEQAPRNLILVAADMARSDPPMTAPFVAELSRRLHGRGTALALPLHWVEQRLADQGLTIDAMVKAESQAQAAAQVSVSHGIGGLRLLASTDWREFVEALSAVEGVLRTDPAAVYPQMDFATRNLYRHAVERLARTGGVEEPAVAETAVALARASSGLPQTHVGWWLHDAGRPVLALAIGVPATLPRRLQAALARHPLPAYGGAIALLTLMVAAGVLLLAGPGLLAQPLAAVAAALLTALLASQFAVTAVNAVAVRGVAPAPLPRLDFSDGIPAAHRSLVVVPTLLTSTAGADALAEALEVRHLANRDRQLLFGLLTDFADAAQEHLPGDAALLAHARAAIDALNARHPGAPFCLFHRPRRWNPREGVWMGHERKRGKLEELNRLLRTGTPGGFAVVLGDLAALQQVRYVITLDTDTQLPRDAARQFVATMAHPLNRPRLGGSPAAPRIVGGHGILQPRVGSALMGGGATLYSRVFGGEPGIDPYTGAISDVYQDLFGEGSFVGKGIYDVDAVMQVLQGRLPDDRVLSHDLLEGGYARSGLLSDVELAEEPPPRYEVDAKRRQRWIRGDWQIAAWLWPTVPQPGGAGRGPNPLTPLSRAKILDNLRRSLVAPAMVALLLLGWLLLPAPALWTGLVLMVLLAPTALALVTDLLRRPGAAGWTAQTGLALASARRHLAQAAFSLAVLPHEALYSLDAIARTLWRLHVSHRRLLEWQASADVGRARPDGALGSLRHTAQRLAVAPVLAVATLEAIGAWRPEARAAATPLLCLWFVAPLVVWWFDRPPVRQTAGLGEAEHRDLRLLARRTWAFFEAHVGPADHHLPPDNVQWNPEERVAHRTSPTNIGLSLLATLSRTTSAGWTTPR
jgi:cyclic beta-1,2-glucan synthetase